MPRKPNLQIQTGAEARAIREKLGFNQSKFWSRIQVTQSGASRYENGRNLPAPVKLLLNMAYGTEALSTALLAQIRAEKKE